MATKAYLEFSNGKTEIVTKGDVIELIDGHKMTFIEMKRTKWIGSDETGKKYNVPVYKDRNMTMPYAKSIIGKNENVIIKNQLNTLKNGDLFAIENAKQSFMFKEKTTKVIAIDLATGTTWRIGLECNFTKIDLNKLKEKV